MIKQKHLAFFEEFFRTYQFCALLSFINYDFSNASDIKVLEGYFLEQLSLKRFGEADVGELRFVECKPLLEV